MRSGVVTLMLVTVALLPNGADAQVTVNPDTLGAMGDGITWDHKAIQAAIDTAGVGGTVVLTHGKIYVVCRRVTVKTGRTLIGNGATIRRCVSPSTFLKNSSSTGDTSIHVDQPELFEIGQSISVFTGPTHDEGEAKSFPRIMGISGPLLFLSEGLTRAYPAGAEVIVVDNMVSTAGADIEVKGVVFDGNRRNNNQWIAWERGPTLVATGSDIEISGNLFLDCWANCLKSFSMNTLVVTDNVFDSVAAAVLHLSSTDSLLFERNQMVDTNIEYAAAEHSEAALTWSSANRRIMVRDNCLNNSRTQAFGTVNRKNNKDIAIEENSICESNGFFSMRLQDEPLPGFEDYGRFIVRNNVAINVGESGSTHGGADLPPIGNLTFTDNEIVNGYLDFSGLDSAVFARNSIVMLDFGMYGPTNAAYEDRAGLITLDKPLNTIVESNTLAGGEKGMYFRTRDATPPDSLVVKSNVVLDSERGGIVTAKVNWLAGNSDQRSDNSGIVLDGNIVSTQFLAMPDDAGILTTRGVTVIDNCSETNGLGAEVTGTLDTLATGTPETLYRNNTLIGELGAVGFHSAEYVSDVLFDTNTVSTDFPPEFGTATGTLLQGNTIDTLASCPATSPPAIPPCKVCETGMPELDGVFLDVKVILEGAYAGSGQMASAAFFQGAIQDSGWAQPYGSSQFVRTTLEYHGTEFIRPSLPDGMIDWVVVALRSSSGTGTELARLAGILMDDGSVRSLDGTPGVFFPGVSDGSYFVVVYHRNHLAVMSSAAVGFLDGHGSWDFTKGQDQAFSSGGNGLKQLESGIFGMFGGDANADGMITASDFNAWLVATKAVSTGYLVEDFEFDGQVTAADFNLWLANTKAVAATQVP